MRSRAAAPTRFARLFAWSGALLFFGSIAYFLVVYATTFGRPARSGDRASAITWNVILFTLFAIHHSVFARLPVRAWMRRTFPLHLERSFYVWVASLLFLAVCAWWRPVPGVAWEAKGATVWLLRALQVAGVWLTLRSAAVLDIRELAGLAPMRERSEMAFKTTGPYGWVRHPIYTGWFVLVWTASPMTMTRLVFAAVSCSYLLIAIPLEERSLHASSAGAYERYTRQVRRKLVPGVY